MGSRSQLIRDFR